MPAVTSTVYGEIEEKVSAIQRAARDMLNREWSTNAFRGLIDGGAGFSESLWQQMAGLGWPSILVSEQYGGLSASFIELTGLAEELGWALAPAPLLASIVAAEALAHSGNEALKEQLLPRIAGGEAVIVLAHAEREVTSDLLRVSCSAASDGAGYRLSGLKLFVPYAHVAEYLLTTARIEGSGELGLFLVKTDSDGMARRALKVIDWSPLYEVSLDGVFVPADHLVATRAEAEAICSEAQLQAVLLRCAEMVGVVGRAVQMAVDYAQMRVAFGRPIGAFQAIKHRLVNHRADLEVARALYQGAAHDIMGQTVTRTASVAMAAFWCMDTLRKGSEGALQVFGGIGFTYEHDVHLFLRRATQLTAELGERAAYRRKIAAHLDSEVA